MRALCKGRKLPGSPWDWRAQATQRGVKKSQATRKPEGWEEEEEEEARSRSKPWAASATRPAMRRPKRGGGGETDAEAAGGAQSGKLQSERIWQEGSSRSRGRSPPYDCVHQPAALNQARKRGYAEWKSEEKRLEIHTHTHTPAVSARHQRMKRRFIHDRQKTKRGGLSAMLGVPPRASGCPAWKSGAIGAGGGETQP